MKPIEYEIPLALNTEEFRELFDEYLTLRRKKKWSVSKVIIKRLLKKLDEMNDPVLAVDALENAILHSWKNVYKPNHKPDLERIKEIENKLAQKRARLQVIWSLHLFSHTANRRKFPDEWQTCLKLKDQIAILEKEVAEI